MADTVQEVPFVSHPLNVIYRCADDLPGKNFKTVARFLFGFVLATHVIDNAFAFGGLIRTGGVGAQLYRTQLEHFL